MERKPILLLDNLPKIGARDISDDLQSALKKLNRKMTRSRLIRKDDVNGGIILVGSHVN